MSCWFTSENDRVLSHIPGFHSYCGLAHPRWVSKGGVRVVLVEYIPSEPTAKT